MTAYRKIYTGVLLGLFVFFFCILAAFSPQMTLASDPRVSPIPDPVRKNDLRVPESQTISPISSVKYPRPLIKSSRLLFWLPPESFVFHLPVFGCFSVKSTTASFSLFNFLLPAHPVRAGPVFC